MNIKPIVPWVGGKRKLLPILHQNLPTQFNHYFEPFAGGAALFFSLCPEMAFLSDANRHLIDAYLALRDHIDETISWLHILEKNHTEKQFFEIRERLPNMAILSQKGASFIYIVRCAYGGIYTERTDGSIASSINRATLNGGRKILDEQALTKASSALQGVHLVSHSFHYLTRPQKGDFVYLDPPYDATFSRYLKGGFGRSQHKLLARFCQELDHVGVNFMLSNSNTEFVRELYDGFDIHEVEAPRSLRKRGEGSRVTELLIRNYCG